MASVTPIQRLSTDLPCDIRVVSPSPPQVTSSPLGCDSPESATAIMDNLIQAIEESTPQNSPIEFLSSGCNGNIDRARPSLKVKPLVCVRRRSPQASPADPLPIAYYTAGTSSQWDIKQMSQFSPIEPMPLGFIKTIFKSTNAPNEPMQTSVHFRQPAPKISPVDKRHVPQATLITLKQPSEMESSTRKTAYMDPRLQNAVKRYRPQSTPVDSKSVRSNTSQSSWIDPRHIKQSNGHTSQPPPINLKSKHVNTAQISPVDLNPSAPTYAQLGAQQASPVNSKPATTATLITPRASQNTLYGTLIDPRSPKNQNYPTSPVPSKSFIRRHLGLHVAPNFSSNRHKKEQPRPEFTQKTAEQNTHRVQSASSVNLNPQRNADAERLPASLLPSEPVAHHNPRPHSPADTRPLTFHRQDEWGVSIQAKSACGIKRSASRRLPMGSRYLGSVKSGATALTQLEQTPMKLEIPQASSTTISPLTRLDRVGNIPRYSPVDFRDLGYVDLWLENANTANCSPNDPSSPLFSEGKASTAPSSPVSAQEGSDSIYFDGCRPVVPSRQNSTGMKSTITNWESLDGCTPQFIQSLNNMKENGRSESPGLDSPTSKYSDDVLPIEWRNCAPQVVSEPIESKFGNAVKISSDSWNSDPGALCTQVEMLKNRYSEQPPMQEKIPTQRSIRKSKPHVSQLIIPPNPSGNVELQTPLNRQLPSLPDMEPLATLEEARAQARIHSAMTPNWSTQRKEIFECSKSVSAPSSPVAEETLVSAMTPSILINATKHLSSTYYNQPISPVFSYSGEEDIYATPLNDVYNLPIPARLSRPLDTWQVPSFFAPKGGLQLRISRRDLTMSKQEWAIESAVTGTPLLKCLAQTNSLSRKRDFRDTDGNHIFGFQRTVGSTRIAETNSGQILFVVRNASLCLKPCWTLTHKNSVDVSAQWVATGDEDYRNFVVLWGGFLVGRISVENERLKHTYIATVNPEMNYCMMAALTTVFDDLRVDEGLF